MPLQPPTQSSAAVRRASQMRTDLISRNAKLSNQHYYLPRELLFQMWSVLKAQYNSTEPYPGDLWDDLPS